MSGFKIYHSKDDTDLPAYHEKTAVFSAKSTIGDFTCDADFILAEARISLKNAQR